MSPREALNLFDQVAANFQGNRQDHVALQTALAVISDLVVKFESELETGHKDQTQEEVLDEQAANEED